MTPIPAIVSQHTEEAAFQWLLRAGAVGAARFRLQDLSKVDARVIANLDGIRTAREEGWRVVCDQLTWKEPGEFFTAAFLAIESSDQSRWDFVIEKLAGAEEGAAGVISALGWHEYDRARPFIRSLLESENPLLRRVGIAGSSIHRKDPENMLTAAANDADSGLRARTIKAIGELGRSDFIPILLRAFSDDDLLVQFAAAKSVAMLGAGDRATTLLQQLAEANLSFSERAALIAGRTMELRETNHWQDALTGEANKRLPIIVAGASGDPMHIPWLIEQTKLEKIARLAGEAFSTITGADLAFIDLDRKPPKDLETGPNDDPNDPNVAMDVDDNLSWPDPARVKKWWSKKQSAFREGTRYLCGKPINSKSLNEILRTGYQRQRAAAAMELQILSPETPLFEVRAPAERQKKLLEV